MLVCQRHLVLVAAVDEEQVIPVLTAEHLGADEAGIAGDDVAGLVVAWPDQVRTRSPGDPHVFHDH